jgi:hypothetical protein
MKRVIFSILMLLLISNISFSQSHVNGIISTGIIKPTKEYFTYGVGLDASILFGITQNFDVTLNSGYLKWSQKDKQNSYFRIIPLYIGGRYYLSQNQIKPYVGLELGINVIEHDNNAFLEKKWGYGLNTGVLFSILNNLQLDVGAKFNSIYYDYSPLFLESSNGIQFINLIHIGFVHSL